MLLSGAVLLVVAGAVVADESIVYRDLDLSPVAQRRVDLDGDLPGGWVWLSELPWLDAKSGWTPNRDGLPRRNRAVDDSALRLAGGSLGAGRTFRAGIGTHAPSRIVYDLAGRYERFRARIGAGEENGTVRFEVRVDGKSVFRSDVARGLAGWQSLDLAVDGAKRLELLVDDAGDGYNSDMANWVQARVRRVGGLDDKPAVSERGADSSASEAASRDTSAAVVFSMRPSVPDVIRDDWQFRETLAAIGDWEKISTFVGEPAAVLPVAVGASSTTTWPHPIPAPLIPRARDVDAITLAATDEADKVRMTRTSAAGTTRETTEPIATVQTGYEHPGGGDHNMWYHGYSRQFTRLCRFRGSPAPFALRIPTPLDLRPGRARIPLTFESVRALKIGVRVDVSAGVSTAGTVWLSAGKIAHVTVPVRLDRPGGGLVVLSLDCDGKTYRVPFLTHVERIAPILAGVERIVAAGHADDAAVAELARLHTERRALLATIRDADEPVTEWRTAFEAACALRRRLLMDHIDFDELLFVKRKPFISEQPYMDAHHLFNLPGGGIYRLSPVRPDGEVRPIVDDLGEGVYRDVCLSWDAKRIVFSFGQGSDDWRPSDPSYHIWEIGVDGTGRRQLTFGPKNDCEPFYLPDGRIGFTSDRPEHFVLCGAARHASILHAMEADGSEITQLSFNVVNEFNPSVLPDGRIIYTRWEYNERSVTSLHSLFTMNPDGTRVEPFYGNQSIRPNVLMFPRAVPDSDKVLSLLTGHHGQTHGPAALIDRRVAANGMRAVEVLNPDMPVIGEKIEDSRVGWASRPWPLSEDAFLVSYTPTVVPWREWTWALYVSDRHGNLALVYRDSEISTTEPIPLVPSRRPPVIAGPGSGDDRADFDRTATLLLLDAYAGQPGIERGSVASLRILEDVPRKGVHEGGVIPVAATSMYTIKRIVGTVPVEADGSAYFRVPANRSLYFALLDRDGLEIQRMRSVVCLRPGEVRTCAGCHESPQTAPPASGIVPAALERAPSAPSPPPWGRRILSYLRDVQPVLDEHCARCHERGRGQNEVLLSGELTDRFAVSYEELMPYVKAAYAMRWDVPEDVYPAAPRTYGSGASRLMEIVAADHHGLQLDAKSRETLSAWIDANAVYYGGYRESWPGRSIFTRKFRAPLDAVFARRCEGCHRGDDGRRRMRFPSIDPSTPQRSRALLAPLAEAAGGWGACGPEVVFRDRNDPDYLKLAAGLETLARALDKNPRRDLRDLEEPVAQSAR